MSRCNITAQLSQAGTLAWFALPNPDANSARFAALSARALMAANTSGALAAAVGDLAQGSSPVAAANTSGELRVEVSLSRCSLLGAWWHLIWHTHATCRGLGTVML